MGRGKILVIDDSEIVRKGVAMTLESAGYTVVAPHITLIVGAVILREKPDLVLLDLDMPTLSGEDVMKLIRRHSSIADTRVVFYSDRPIAALKAASKAAGTAGYIRKGPLEGLVAQVQHWLDRDAQRHVHGGREPREFEDHCLYDASCEIFESLSLAGATSFWRQQYCDSRTHCDCARFRLLQRGERPPRDLLPNGMRLAGRKRKASSSK